MEQNASLREQALILRDNVNELSKIVNNLDDELFKGKPLNKDGESIGYPVEAKTPSVSDILEETDNNLRAVLALAIKISQRVSEQF